MSNTYIGKPKNGLGSYKASNIERQRLTPPRCVYIDMNSTLIRWEDEPSDHNQQKDIKEVFCGIDQDGESLIRFASIQKDCLNLINQLREIKHKKTQEPKYNVQLISSSPKIYTNAINTCFNLGFLCKEIISAEEFYDRSNPYQIVSEPYGFKESSKDIFISIEPKDSARSITKRTYLGIDKSRQLTPLEMEGVLKRKMLKNIDTKLDITLSL